MALKDSTAIKTAIANASIEINLALEDDTVPGTMPDEIKHPSHPIRKLERLFLMDLDGQFSSNDAYIDSVIDAGGVHPIKSQSDRLDKIVQ